MAHIEPWARLATTTINNYLREMTEPVWRDHPLMALLRKKGRVVYKQRGNKIQWEVKYRVPTPSASGDMEETDIGRENWIDNATLNWKMYTYGHAISRFEELANGDSKVALVKIMTDVTKTCAKAFNDYLAKECFVDSGATGNSKKLDGLESMLGGTASGTYVKMAAPNDTYAGLACTLGSEKGGSWDDVYWPLSTGDEKWEFWSPRLYNVTASTAFASGGWQADSKTWPATWREAFELDIAQAQQRNHKRDLFLSDGLHYTQALNSVETKERINLTPSPNTAMVASLGFNSMMFSGVEWVTGYGVPTTTTYGLTIDKITLRCMQDQLVKMEGDVDIARLARRMVYAMFGNLQFEAPYYFSKFYPYT